MDKFLKFLNFAESKGLKVNSTRGFPLDILPKTEVVYIKALLEDRFTPRKFTYEEVEDLLKEITIDDSIPQWYKDKWFKK